MTQLTVLFQEFVYNESCLGLYEKMEGGATGQVRSMEMKEVTL